jgi:hypothetical protein
VPTAQLPSQTAALQAKDQDQDNLTTYLRASASFLAARFHGLKLCDWGENWEWVALPGMPHRVLFCPKLDWTYHIEYLCWYVHFIRRFESPPPIDIPLLRLRGNGGRRGLQWWVNLVVDGTLRFLILSISCFIIYSTAVIANRLLYWSSYHRNPWIFQVPTMKLDGGQIPVDPF